MSSLKLHSFIRHTCYNNLFIQTCFFHTKSFDLARDSYTTAGFYEKDRKGEYGLQVSRKEKIRLGIKDIRKEIAKFNEEIKESLAQDPLLICPGDRDMVWVFDGNKKCPNSENHPSNPEEKSTLINPITSTNRYHDSEYFKSVFTGWVVTTDQDHGEGYSSASLTTSPAGHAFFRGTLSTDFPKDGIVHRAGYCNMSAPRPMKSFGRDSYYDWSDYTHMVIRCRGDGRSYILNLGSAGFFDISWNDMYTYVLYTRGGPHWQTYKVPFSKFLLSSKGVAQDKQCPIDPSRITSVGISVGDKINAPFKLEIDYIAVENDPSHVEEFAYELYKVPNFYLD